MLIKPAYKSFRKEPEILEPGVPLRAAFRGREEERVVVQVEFQSGKFLLGLNSVVRFFILFNFIYLFFLVVNQA
jgi:hypothetical protein